jgi:hypothetical protein
MIRSRPFIGLSELCLLDVNSEEVHNLQSPAEFFLLLKSPLAVAAKTQRGGGEEGEKKP